MAAPDVIAEYVDRLARGLAFDPALSQRVRREAEDHLWESVAADPAGGGPEAERRFTLRTIDIWRVENGKFAEHWDIVDYPGLQKQLRGE